MRGDKSFAYDLLVRPGRVSGRVALLLRSAERKPVAGKICESFSLPISGSPCCESLEGGNLSFLFFHVVICMQGNPTVHVVFVIPDNAAFICSRTDTL